MRKSLLSLVLLGLTAFSGPAVADAPLKSTLGLDVEQARQVDEIQSQYRREYAAKRGDHNREERALRRARIANDSEQIAAQEKVVAGLKEELRQIKASEDAAIRKLLTPEQNKKFDAYIETRNEMVGSSRDVRNQ
jgi:Spy/CpxP family protein refolding chaperone